MKFFNEKIVSKKMINKKKIIYYKEFILDIIFTSFLN